MDCCRQDDAVRHADCRHSSEQLTALLSSSSPLLRHVGQLGQRTNSLLLRANQLPALCHAFPQLLSLSTRLNMQFRGASLLFPPRLQQLHLFSVNWPDEANDIAMAFLAAIRQLQLHTLQLDLPYGAVSLAQLQQLPLLRDLELDRLRLERFAAELRALHWLHRLYIHLPFTGEQASHASLCHALLRDAPGEEMRALQWRLRHQHSSSRCSRFSFLIVSFVCMLSFLSPRSLLSLFLSPPPLSPRHVCLLQCQADLHQRV
jgi:hypothetical protein